MDKPYVLREAWDKIAHKPAVGKPPSADPVYYTNEEKEHIRAEALRLYDVARTQYALELKMLNERAEEMGKPSRVKRRFMLSAGAPGAGKTTLLEKILADDYAMQAVMFVDPDERAMKLMPAYYADIQKFADKYEDKLVGLALAYTKWRWASNWISNTMMNRAGVQGRDVLLGTTATSPHMRTLNNNAHALGYESDTLIVCAPQEVRFESARRRFEDEGTRFTHDTQAKGAAFYERLPDLVMYTHAFSLYWRDKADGDAVLVARAERGNINIYNTDAFQAIYNDLLATTKGELGLQSLTSMYMGRFDRGEMIKPKF